MRIRQLITYRLHLRLKRAIRHASKTRSQSENLLVSCTLCDGTQGWGEGVPREYVTGETVDGALQLLAAASLAEQLDRDCQSWDDVIQLCDSSSFSVPGDDRGCRGNALRCAVELSILDAFGRLFNEPLSAVTDRFAPAADVAASRPSVRYSAVITAESPRAEVVSAAKMRLYGFRHCKIKVGMPNVDERQRLTRLRRWLGKRMDIRLDANEAWSPGEVVERVEELLPCQISSVEQPVAHAEVGALAEVRRRLPVRIMLDESLTSSADAEIAIRDGTCDLFNIRLSKCGGYLNSLRLAARAKGAGLGYQLGCHPGESGILSAAGRHFAGSVGNIEYLEGSYDRHVLARQLTREDITFGYGGRAPVLQRPGLGVSVDADALAEMASQEQAFDVD